MFDSQNIPDNHPVKKLFRGLTDRALTQSSLTDKDIFIYLVDLLIDFMYVENLYYVKDGQGRRLEYLMDILQKVEEIEPRRRKSYYKHVGDYSMFILGMFPENLSYGKRAIPASYYADTGRQSYIAASELEPNHQATVVYRKLAEKFERCVLSIHWVREYTTDPFYQYMLRQFGVT